jgi:hypothetical protein
MSPNPPPEPSSEWGKRLMEESSMFSRLLTVALLTAGTALAFSTAQAQTSGTSSGTGSSTMPKTTTSPSTSSGTSSSTMGSGSGSATMGSGSGSKTMGSSGSTSSSTQQAQQPMSSGTFNVKNYKTKTECLNAASAQHADRTLCNSLK